MKYTKSLNLLMLVLCGFAQNVMGCDPELWARIDKTSIYIAQGDITKLQNVDAIVNASNDDLQHWGGIAQAISKASSKLEKPFPTKINAKKALLTKLQIYSDAMPNFPGSNEKCPTGQAVITSAFDLETTNNIKHIIHGTGPQGRYPDELRQTYQSILRVAQENKLESVAFCAISTKIFGYDIKDATPVALAAVRDFVKKNVDNAPSKIIFVLFDANDYAVYKNNSKILLGETLENSGVVVSHNPTTDIPKDIEPAHKEQTRTSYFRKFLNAAIPASLLGLIIWYLWQRQMN